MKNPSARTLRLAVLVLLPIVPFSAQTTPVQQSADDANRLVLEGTKLLTSGDTDAALESFQKARKIAPDDVDAIIGLARAESLKPELYSQARADYEAALSIRPTADLYAELAFALYLANDFQGAITTSKKALTLTPELLAAEIVYGDSLGEIGDFDGAINVLSKACVQARAAHPDANGSCGVWQAIPYVPGITASIAAERGWVFFKKGDCPSLSLAEKDFIEAVSYEPNNPDLHYRLGNLLMKEGWQGSASCARNQSERDDYLDRAWYQFRGAVNLDSKNALYRVEFVALSEVLKRKPEYDAGIATQPSKSEIDQLLTEHQITESGKPTDLLQSLESLEEKALDAERNETLSATQRAVADAKEAIRLDPMDGFAWGKLGSAYFDLGDYKNAEDATQKAVEIFDERAKSAPAPILAELARDRRSKGLDVPPDLAEAESNDVSTDLSMLGVYLNQLADICHKLHKKREAARYREKALRVFDVQRMMQSSETTPHSLNAAQQPTVRVVPQGGSGGQTRPKPLPLNPAPPCPLPVHETCQMPAFNPQPYDPNNPQPYKAPDTRDYDRCVLGNQREDARYQQCLQQQPRQQQNH